MKVHLKNYLPKIKRIYHIIFENRELETIRSDFYNDLWISKKELQRLFQYEIDQLVQWAVRERDDKNLLLSHFNIGTMRAYYELEERTPKSGKKM